MEYNKQNTTMHWTGSRPWQEKKQKIIFYQKDTETTDVHLKQICKLFSVIMCQNLNQFVNISDGVCQMTLVKSTCSSDDSNSLLVIQHHNWTKDFTKLVFSEFPPSSNLLGSAMWPQESTWVSLYYNIIFILKQ